MFPRFSQIRFLLLLLAMLPCATSLQADEKPLYAYVGTFSSPLKDMLPSQVDLPPGNGRGIHVFRVDRSTGALLPASEFLLGTSPSHIAINAQGTRLYSTNETDRVGPDKHGSVTSFSIDHTDGHLERLNSVDSGGAGPTYASLHPAGKHLFVANYFGGSISVFPILADGRLAPASDIQEDSGEIGPTKATHAPPGSFAISGHDRTHAHMIEADASGKFVLHIDLGLDRIYVWQFDQSTGKLRPSRNGNGKGFVSLPPGDGPRHFAFHPNKRWLYSIQEEGSTIVLFDFDPKTGSLSQRATISSLPDGFAGSNFCSEILVSADGRFVYAGNRLHDSVAVFSVGVDGTLTFVADEWTRGDYPRSFSFDPTGTFLYVCNQRADHVAIFRVDRKTGKLSFTGQYVPVGNPSAIVFLDTASVASER